MNFPEAIEYAAKETLGRFAGDGNPPLWLRSAQCQEAPGNRTAKQYFPQVYLTCSSKYGESGECTYAVRLEAAVTTWFEDDRDCSMRARFFGEVERVFDQLASGGEVEEFFTGKVRESFPSFALGGVSPQEAVPELSEGAQVMAWAAVIHFSL